MNRIEQKFKGAKIFTNISLKHTTSTGWNGTFNVTPMKKRNDSSKMARANMAKKGGKIHFHLPFFFTVLHFPGKTSFARRDTLKNIYEEELNGWKVNEFFNLPLLYVSQYEGVSFFYFFFFFWDHGDYHTKDNVIAKALLSHEALL